jgi:hypothetical protein
MLDHVSKRVKSGYQNVEFVFELFPSFIEGGFPKRLRKWNSIE